MFEKITQYWNDYYFEIILSICLIFIAIYSLIRLIKGKKGKWDHFSDEILNTPAQYKKSKKRGPPKESKGEIECRRVLEKIFNKPFNKARPNFLNNPVTGGDFNLEIDCFNQELRLGCEYNGVQHYKYVPFFHKNKEAFLNQKYRDEMKRTKCREFGITLIEVPHTVKVENIENFIVSELKKYYY
jgi:hypothetical protein